jgi:hypothetical protein
MTAKELLKHQFDDAGYQLGKALEGIDASLDFKLTEGGMTPRETVAHLGECYTAILTETSGEKHSWGTYQPSTTEWPALLTEIQNLLEKAVAAAIEKEGWEDHASAFGPAHDYYHVGQLSMIRISQDAGWDPYSIYKG